MALGAALGLGSLLLQNNANHAANAAAQAAANKQQALIDRQTKLFDTMMGIANDADRNGAFNPDTAIQNATKKSAYETGMAENNAAGAARTLGYRVGDTAPIQGINKISNDASQHLIDTKLALTRQALLDKVNVFGAANPGSLNAGIQAEGGQQQLALSQVQNPAGLVGSIQPFLQGLGKSKPSSGFNLGTADTWGDLNAQPKVA